MTKIFGSLKAAPILWGTLIGDTVHRLSETLIFAIGDTKLMSPIKQNLLPIGDTYRGYDISFIGDTVVKQRGYPR